MSTSTTDLTISCCLQAVARVKLQALGPSGISLATTTTAITITTNPAQLQLQPLQVVVMLLLLPQLPPQVCQSASDATTNALGVGIDCCCHLCNALSATVICAIALSATVICAIAMPPIIIASAVKRFLTACNSVQWQQMEFLTCRWL